MTFIPFKGKYSFILPDYLKLILPINIHINWEEDNNGKIFEISHKKLSFGGKDILIKGIFRNGPYNFEWEHNHKSKYSFGYVKYENEKILLKKNEYKLVEEGISITEGLWNQTHIKMPDKYLLGDGSTFITEKIITKDKQPPRPYAPFSCEIWVNGTKTNDWKDCKSFKYRHHNIGDPIEKYRVYGRKWVIKRIDYASWGDSIKYQKAKGYNGPSSGKFTLIW